MYLATFDTTQKWTHNVWCWVTILGQLAIHFEEKFNIYAKRNIKFFNEKEDDEKNIMFGIKPQIKN